MKYAEIKPVKMFPCPITGKLFKTAKAAQRNAEKEQRRIEAEKAAAEQAQKTKERILAEKNYIRLNLSDIKDLPRMLTEKAKEFLNIDIKDLVINVNFSESISNSHEAPINGIKNWNRDNDKPKYYPGWSGQIKGLVTVNNPTTSFSSAADYLFNQYGHGFLGFHTSCGCPGAIDGRYAMDIGFYLFLSDFPLLAAKYEVFKIEKAKFLKNQSNISSNKNDAYEFAVKWPEVVELEEKIKELTAKRVNLIEKCCEKYLADNKPELVEISPEFEILKGQFFNRYNLD